MLLTELLTPFGNDKMGTRLSSHSIGRPAGMSGQVSGSNFERMHDHRHGSMTWASLQKILLFNKTRGAAEYACKLGETRV
jgi:hypothetical protein